MTMAAEPVYVKVSYVDLCSVYAVHNCRKLLHYRRITILSDKKHYFRMGLLLHHQHVAVFIQGQAIDLLPRIESPANRPVDARTFVKVGRRLLALRDVEMQS